MKSYKLYLLSLLSGLLLTFAWFPHGFLPLIFIAFVPLLFVEQAVSNHSQKYKSLILFACCYLTFLTWNVLVTWWVKNASFGGAAMAILCNSLLMTIVFLLFHKTKKRVGEKYSALIFISFWLAWEYFHLNWDLSWPWLTLGNVFADTPSIIQWYEYTGVFGGSLWILIVNYLVFKLTIKQNQSPFSVSISGSEGGGNGFEQSRGMFFFKSKVKIFITVSVVIIIPIIISIFICGLFGKNITQQPKGIEIVIAQPNIDPYYEKFNGDFDAQIIKMLELAARKVNQETEYLILPETALAENSWEDQMEQSSSIQLIRKFLKSFPHLKIVVGASSSIMYRPGDQLSITARKFPDSNDYYDAYNTALQIDSSNTIQIYHKSKLVPGVEKMPFPFIFKHLENFAIDLGGTAGSLGTQEDRTVFKSTEGDYATAPVICYESIYGEYVAEYINNGAQFISIITNDGWWGDTPGYKQHLKYGALRAIETRKWIARSANTGISCFITPLGEIIQPTQWWVPAVISQKIQLTNEQTFYVRFGDYIAKAGIYLAILFLIYYWLIRFKIIKK